MEDHKLEEQEQGKCLSPAEDSALDEEDQRDFHANYCDRSFNANRRITAETVSSSSFEDVVGNTYSTNNHASMTATNASIPSKAQSVHSKDASFEERCNQLLRFKEEFGHCTVPNNYSDNTSLGHWCDMMRTAYSNLQKGRRKVGDINLKPDRIERLEEIGFKWHVHDALFHKHYHELVAFKEKFGHCIVSQNYKGNPSLGYWCKAMRRTYGRIQKMGGNRSNILPQHRIERLEEIGFKWQIRPGGSDDVFEKRYHELVAFKEKFGHCIVPKNYKGNPPLGYWCKETRHAYSRIQKAGENRSNLLPQHRIERLEEIGFKWQIRQASSDDLFKKRYHELVAFKEKFGHCNVPRKFANNPPLGLWCKAMQITYNRIQMGMKPRRILSPDWIQLLQKVGLIGF